MKFTGISYHTINSKPVWNTASFNFFFVVQDLMDRIDSYFQRIAFQRNLLLIGFKHSASQVFSNVNKQSSLEWRCVNWKGDIMAESGL